MCQRLLPRNEIEATDEYDVFAFEEPNIPSDGEIRDAFETEDEPPFCRHCGDAGCVACLGWD